MASEASETTTEVLRAAIETALRRRDPRATVQRSPTESDRSLWIARWPRLEIMTRGDDGHFGLDALRALAVACGLRVDLCPACNGRGRRAYGRETEDGCDECECSGVVVVDPAEEVERLREREASHAAEMEASRDAAAQAFDDLVARVWRAATGDTHEGPANVEALLAAVSDPREQLREIRRTVIASVRGEEYASTLTSAALDERAASTGEDVACLVARMRTAEAAVVGLRTDNARLDDATRGALNDLARVRGELDAARAALDRAHHAVREHGPRCSHPECDALAPLRCDDCGRRFCDEHDDGLAGHDPGFGPQAHAVGPDDLMAGAAMRAAVAR